MSARTQPVLVPQEAIDQAARRLLEAAPEGSEVILFGSYARGSAAPHSDLDFLVVEPNVRDEIAESVRLRRAVGSIGASVDVLVVDRVVFDRWRQLPGNVMYWAHQEGRRYV